MLLRLSRLGAASHRVSAQIAMPLQVALRGRIIAAHRRCFSTQTQFADQSVIPERFLCAPTPTAPFAFDSFTVCFVDTIDALAKTKAAVLSSSRVGLDTEFVKGFNYTPSLELVQIATSDSTIHVVDCRAIETLQRGSLVELLTAVVSRPVVLHAADEDLRLMYLWTKKIPTCIFDTQLAAKTAGIGPLDGGVIGYGPLVQQVLDIKLDKSQTMTDWRLRPLTKEQISYAANDVKYLFALQDKLIQQLTVSNRLSWLPQLTQPLFDAARYMPREPLLAWRHVFRLSKIQGHGIELECIFRELAAWRERIAVKTNTAAGSVMRDDMLISIAQQCALHVFTTTELASPSTSAEKPAETATKSQSNLVAFDSLANEQASNSIRLRDPIKLMAALRRIQGVKPMVLDRNTNTLIASVQRGLDTASAFRRSPFANGLNLTSPLAQAQNAAADSATDANAKPEVSETDSNYQSALHKYFESTLPGAPKSVVHPVAAPTVAQPAAVADATANSAALITLMQFWVKIKAESLSIPHSLLSGIDSASLKQLIAAPDSPSSPLMNSWQKDAVGDDLMKLKSGSVALAWNPNTRSIQLVDVKL